jgi:hypothetical protein
VWLAASLVAGAVAGVVFTWPLVRVLDHGLLDDETLDGFQFLWNAWWVRHALAKGANPLHTRLLFAPGGIGLFWHTLSLVTGVLSLPFGTGGGFAGAVRAQNVMNLLAPALTVGTATLFVARLTGRPGVGLVAGLLLVASGFCVRQMHGPHLGALYLFVGALLAWDEAVRRRTPASSLVAVVALVALFFASQDYAAMGLVVCAVDAGLAALGRAAGRRTLGEVTILALAVVVIAVATRIFGAEMPERPPFRWVVWNSAYASGFVVPPWLAGRWPYFASSIYLGAVPIVGALVAQVVAPRQALRWNVAALACLTIALGPMLQAGPPTPALFSRSDPIPPVWPGWPTPYRLLYDFVPGFALSRGPWRWAGGARLCLVMATACGLGRLASRVSPRTAVGVAALLVAVATAEAIPDRLRVVPAVFPAGYSVLAHDTGAVVDLPSGIRRGSFALFSSYYMAYQTGHGHPIVDGTVARLPGGRRHLFERDDYRLAEHPEVEYVVLHRALFAQAFPRAPSLRLAREARAGGDLVFRDRALRVYRLRSYRASPKTRR